MNIYKLSVEFISLGMVGHKDFYFSSIQKLEEYKSKLFPGLQSTTEEIELDQHYVIEGYSVIEDA